MKKTVVSVDMYCTKCMRKAMKSVARLEGINSIALDPSKNTVTVIGDADPIDIMLQVRKFRNTAELVSVGPPKAEEKQREDTKTKEKQPEEPKPNLLVCQPPRICQRCDAWYVVDVYSYNPCSII